MAFFHAIPHALQSALQSVWIAGQILLLSAVLFGSLAVLLKGDEAFKAFRRASHEVRLNLSLYFLDALFVGPVLALLVLVIRGWITSHGLVLVDASLWNAMPVALTALIAVTAGDFVGYWRHRLEHTNALWPAHAVHHSDAEMNWLTLARFHPINRLTTSAIDVAFLALLGLPDWALVVNEMVRHYYGEFIHAGLPWTLGPARYLMVSPAMHAWHHARDVKGAGSNFATVFSIFDRTFGTFYVPGPCTVPLGVRTDMGTGLTGQLLYPFIAWRDRFRRRRVMPRGVTSE